MSTPIFSLSQSTLSFDLTKTTQISQNIIQSEDKLTIQNNWNNLPILFRTKTNFTSNYKVTPTYVVVHPSAASTISILFYIREQDLKPQSLLNHKFKFEAITLSPSAAATTETSELTTAQLKEIYENIKKNKDKSVLESNTKMQVNFKHRWDEPKTLNKQIIDTSTHTLSQDEMKYNQWVATWEEINTKHSDLVFQMNEINKELQANGNGKSTNFNRKCMKEQYNSNRDKKEYYRVIPGYAVIGLMISGFLFGMFLTA